MPLLVQTLTHFVSQWDGFWTAFICTRDTDICKEGILLYKEWYKKNKQINTQPKTSLFKFYPPKENFWRGSDLQSK